MRHAPPVSVLCRGRGWRAVQACIAGLGAAASVLWTAQHVGAPLPAAVLAGLVACGCAVSVAWCLLRQLPTTLRWDGQGWQADGQAVHLLLVVDLGIALLLRWQRVGDRPWKWTAVSASDAGPAWHGLRIALLAHAARNTRQTSAW